MKDSIAWVGLDVHDVSVSVAVAPIGAEPYSLGNFDASEQSLRKVFRRLERKAHKLCFTYEAGPFGYELYRMIEGMGHRCTVAAPSRIPQEPGRRVKTDRRDALALSALLRGEMLTPVWVPDPSQEAMRDLVRAREYAKGDQTRARHRLTSMLRRHGRRSPERSNWTLGHWAWIARQQWERRELRASFDHYVTCIHAADERIAALEGEMIASLEGWSLEPLACALMSLRGVALVGGMTLAAELGDVSRFPQAPELMSFCGLTPGQHSSGKSMHTGPITKRGNAHVRRVLVEAAHSYRHGPRVSVELKKRSARTSESVRRIAWKAQQRLHGKYRRLMARGLPTQKVMVALARELLGFVWSIGREVELVAPPGA
jgi:transposase